MSSDSHPVNPDPDKSIRGKILEALRVNDQSTQGNEQWVEDYELSHRSGHLPLEFGLLSSQVYNERNGNKSRIKNTYVDVEDLHELPSVTHSGLDNLGADDTYSSTILRDATDLSVDDLESGHFVVNSAFKGLDRKHGNFEKTYVKEWQPRVAEGRFAREAGFNRTTTTKLVVKATDPWPDVDATTIDQTREHIGKDKFLQTHVEAPEGFGSFQLWDMFGMENCKTITEHSPVPFTLTAGDNDLDTIVSKVVELTPNQNMYVKTWLPEGWPVLTSYEEEPTTGVRVKVTREVVGVADTVQNAVVGKSVNVKQVGCGKYVRVTREIDDEGDTGISNKKEIEHHHVEYDFPQYLDPDNPFPKYSTGAGTPESPYVDYLSYGNPNLSSTHRLKVPCRFEITYHKTFPVLSEVFQFKTIDFQSDGWQIISTSGGVPLSFNFSNIITDEFDFVTFMYHQGLHVLTTETIPNSSPNASNYVDHMRDGDEAMILEEITKWKYNMYRRVQVFMIFPDLRFDSFPTTGTAVETYP